MAKKPGRYQALIEKIFFDHYTDGATEFVFDRTEIKPAAETLDIELPANLGDVIYSFRFRTEFPERVIATQLDGMEWVIELAGRGRYRFNLLTIEPLAKWLRRPAFPAEGRPLRWDRPTLPRIMCCR